jgi:hypothetical protein
MKKFFTVIVFFAILLGTISVAVYYRFYVKEFNAERLLPEGAVAVLKVNDANHLIQDFSQTELWNAVSQLNIGLLMKESGASQEAIKNYDQMIQMLTSPPARLLLDKFFGQELIIGIYPMEIKQFDESSYKDILRHIYVVTKLSGEAKFLDILVNIFKSINDLMTIETVEYRGEEITTFALTSLVPDNERLAYVKIGDYLVIGVSVQAAKDCLDVRAYQKKSLVNDANFMLAETKFLEDPEIFSYINLASIRAQLQEEVLSAARGETQKDRVPMDQLKERWDRLRGADMIAWSSQFGAVTEIKTSYLFDREEMNQGQDWIYFCEKEDNRSVDLVPKDVLAYSWRNCFDFNGWWQTIENDPRNIGKAYELREILANWGIDIENDILGALEQELVWYVDDVNIAGTLPILEGSVFLRIKDKSKIQSIMSKLDQQDTFALDKGEHKSNSFYAFDLPFAFDFDPSYMMLGDYLVIASNPASLKRNIDAWMDPEQRMIQNPRIQKVKLNLDKPVNSVLYLELDRVVQKVAAVLEQTLDWFLAKYKQSQAYEKGSRQRLEELTARVDNLITEIENFEKELQDLNIRQKSLEVRQQPVDEVVQRKAEVNDLLIQKENLLVTARQKEEEQQIIVDGFKEGIQIDPILIKLYMNEAVYPLISSLESFKVIGSTMNLTDSAFESTTLMNMR